MKLADTIALTIVAGGPGSGRHPAGNGHTVEWNHEDPATNAFGQAYLARQKEVGIGRSGAKAADFAKTSKLVENKGSYYMGHSIYEHAGAKFRVTRYPGGRSFKSTEHYIKKLE